MKITSYKHRLTALALGATLLSSALFTSAPAHAADSKSWKYGAIGLGVLGAYALSKGKNVEGAAALGGAYYAYKKSQSDKKEEQRDDQWRNARNGTWDDWNRNDLNRNDARGQWRNNGAGRRNQNWRPQQKNNGWRSSDWRNERKNSYENRRCDDDD